jgi:two-component system response regulator RegA
VNPGESVKKVRVSSVRSVRKILLVDDVELVLRAWARQCKREGKIPLCASNRAEALDLARREKPDMAVVDLIMPGDSGLAVVRDLKKLRRNLFTILVSGAMSVDYAMEGLAAGADDCFDKDTTIKQLIARVERGVRPAVRKVKQPTLKDVEWQYIVRVLTDHNGNITHAARALGLPRVTLQRKIRRQMPSGENPVPRVNER